MYREILLKFALSIFLIMAFIKPLPAQKFQEVRVMRVKGENKIMVTAGGKPFTTFFFPDTMAKPVLFPIYAPGDHIITRGYPLMPRSKDPSDHPHQVGLWFNYENVNGLDFWNNSFAIPPEKKSAYGQIRTDSLLELKSGPLGLIAYHALWTNQDKKVLLRESTRLYFTSYPEKRIIDRECSLQAEVDLGFPDAKDGLLGLRVARELELPSAEPKEFKDANGVVTKVDSNKDYGVSGNYLTSEGKEGDSAWGTRARWCLLYGRLANDTVSILIIDHPRNPGYPTYWHSRGYGLFAANPLGAKIFSNGKEELNFHLKRGETVRFSYRIVIATGKRRLQAEEINRLTEDFIQVTPSRSP